MKITRIELQGFRGFRDFAEISVPDGYLVIQGPNGAGKSTICDAIEFGLTGGINKYPIEKSAKESVADYIWWRGEGDASDHFVQIHFETDAGNLFSVRRTPDACDKSTEEIRSALCTAGSPDSALQVLIETTLIRDESISALSLDISETERYQRVQRALGAVQSRNLPERAEKVARKADELHKLNIAAEDAVRKELANSLGQLSQVRTAIIEDRELKQAEDDLRALIRDNTGSHGDLIVSARSALMKIQADAQAQLTAVARLIPMISELTVIRTPQFVEELRHIEASIATLQVQVKIAAEARIAAQERVNAEREADALAATLAAILSHGSAVGLQGGHCPLCDTPLSNENFRAAIAKGNSRLSRDGGRAAAAEQELAKATAQHSKLTNELEIATRSLAALENRRSAGTILEKQINDLLLSVGLQTDELNDPNISERISNAARERTLFIQQRLRILEGSSALTQARELEARNDTLRSEAERLAVISGRSQRAVTSAKSIQHTISRTAGEMLDERLATISPLLSELFLRLKPHGDWRSIEYRIRGDVRRFLSLAVGGDLNPQFVFSSGQRRVTGLAFLLSVHLSRHWCNWRTLMLDDPVQHIDDYRALNLVEVLAAIRRDGRQIICAVEDAALANLLCRRLSTREGQSGSLLTLEPGPQGVSRVKSVEGLRTSSLRILDRISMSATASS